MSDDRIIVGTISGSFGVHGDVRLKSFCADPEALADYTPLTRADGTEIMTIVIKGQTKGALIARVDGITTKEEADGLRGMDLFARRDQLPSLPDDEFYHTDLVGLMAFDTGGEKLGRIKAVQTNGAEDLLEVISPTDKDTVLVPFTKAIVPTVDLAAGRLVIDPPGGLFSDEAAD
ncbi:16S rRNA processing protein RimM [Octadecabacter temperatus]|uniref:Ribosome maturation factor RimM n=1 Tax=Octadecabacter temperatus TaxID=1458307 RepID=A0A0K0Y8V3_9RHOB|nr:ribosome maturation factor RimM [Octadecabacter temperatus]AKS47297.1 Ribosome maturation factor RimM [Octadecabacter temperatus]SIO44295.1 16S rRNA processing protein RimM [Octadecabacter temperatus]